MRMLSTVLSVALLGATLAVPGRAMAAKDPFSDDDGTPYEQAIEALAVKEIVAGCDDDGQSPVRRSRSAARFAEPGSAKFCPTAPVRRDQAAALLARAFALPATSRDMFSDDDGNEHEDAVNRLAAAGISQGCAKKGAYCGDDMLRRNQMAALLVRAAKVDTTKRRYFRDVGGGYSGAVNSLAAAGVTGGCRTRPAYYCPHRRVLRGEMAVFLARVLDLRPRTDLEPLPRPRRAKPKRAARPKRTNTVWDRLAACESGGNWSINTGNSYYGGLQFSLSSWRAVGGSGYPHRASRSEQIRRGKRLKARQGWGAWPSCSRKLGLR